MQPSTTNQPTGVGSDDLQNDIFVEQPLAPEPVNKRGIGLAIFLTILGIIALGALLVFALVSSADSLARGYTQRAYKTLSSSQKQLKYFEPSEALNKRDLTTPLQALSLDATSQPQLPQVLFFGQMSTQYVASQRVEMRVETHYKNLESYTIDVRRLLSFDDEMQIIFVEEAALFASVKQDDPLQIRSFAGTQQSYSQRIKKLTIANELKDTRKQIAELYDQKADAYRAWANAVEAGDVATVQSARATLVSLDSAIQERVTDTRFSNLMTPRYEKLVSEHKKLLSLTAS